MKTLLTIILKIILFPIALTAQLLSVVISMLAGVSTLIAGPFCLFLLVMAIVSGVRHEWLNVGILSGTFVAVQVIYLAAATVTNICQSIYVSWARI